MVVTMYERIMFWGNETKYILAIFRKIVSLGLEIYGYYCYVLWYCLVFGYSIESHGIWYYIEFHSVWYSIVLPGIFVFKALLYLIVFGILLNYLVFQLHINATSVTGVRPKISIPGCSSWDPFCSAC